MPINTTKINYQMICDKNVNSHEAHEIINQLANDNLSKAINMRYLMGLKAIYNYRMAFYNHIPITNNGPHLNLSTDDPEIANLIMQWMKNLNSDITELVNQLPTGFNQHIADIFKAEHSNFMYYINPEDNHDSHVNKFYQYVTQHLWHFPGLNPKEYELSKYHMDVQGPYETILNYDTEFNFIVTLQCPKNHQDVRTWLTHHSMHELLYQEVPDEWFEYQRSLRHSVDSISIKLTMDIENLCLKLYRKLTDWYLNLNQNNEIIEKHNMIKTGLQYHLLPDKVLIELINHYAKEHGRKAYMIRYHHHYVMIIRHGRFRSIRKHYNFDNLFR